MDTAVKKRTDTTTKRAITLKGNNVSLYTFLSFCCLAYMSFPNDLINRPIIYSAIE